jgi:hypothetical protein
MIWLINGDQEVLDLEAIEPEISRMGFMTISQSISRCIRVVLNM